jgi:hypothetical protein
MAKISGDLQFDSHPFEQMHKAMIVKVKKTVERNFDILLVQVRLYLLFY